MKRRKKQAVRMEEGVRGKININFSILNICITKTRKRGE
jgi:hypothetical protein